MTGISRRSERKRLNKFDSQATTLTLLCIWGSTFWKMLFPQNSWWGFLPHAHSKFSRECTHGFVFKWLYSFQPATTITLAHTQTPSCCLPCSIPTRDSNPGARRSLPPDDPRAPTFLAFIKAWRIKPSPPCLRAPSVLGSAPLNFATKCIQYHPWINEQRWFRGTVSSFRFLPALTRISTNIENKNSLVPPPHWTVYRGSRKSLHLNLLPGNSLLLIQRFLFVICAYINCEMYCEERWGLRKLRLALRQRFRSKTLIWQNFYSNPATFHLHSHYE